MNVRHEAAQLFSPIFILMLKENYFSSKTCDERFIETYELLVYMVESIYKGSHLLMFTKMQPFSNDHD